MSNLDLWNKVCKTDPKNTKEVKFGRKFTAIDPHSQIKAATEQFGSAGIGWGWSVSKIIPLEAINEIGVLVRLWHGYGGEIADGLNDRFFIEQFGQAGLFINKEQTMKDGDCLKKATTDGLTKCLSYLGFNADIFEGKFEDNKYVQQVAQDFAQDAQAERAAEYFKPLIDEDSIEETHQKIKDGWARLNQEQQKKVYSLLHDKALDCNRKYKTLLDDHLSYKGEEI